MPVGTQFRKPLAHELRLLDLLVARAPGLRLAPGWRDALLVSPMSDGGMGSLKLAAEEGHKRAERRSGRRAAELAFDDADGVRVLASLNLDDQGNLLELDVWKTDFSALIRMPDVAATEDS